MTPGQTYLQRLDEIPPPLCRLIARSKGHAPRILTMVEIAAAAGLTWQKCWRISKQKSFARVPIEDAEKFRLGCGITLKNERRHKEFILRNFKRPTGFATLLGTYKPEWRESWRNQFIRRILKRL